MGRRARVVQWNGLQNRTASGSNPDVSSIFTQAKIIKF
jgi:hypothetical protein